MQSGTTGSTAPTLTNQPAAAEPTAGIPDWLEALLDSASKSQPSTHQQPRGDAGFAAPIPNHPATTVGAHLAGNTDWSQFVGYADTPSQAIDLGSRQLRSSESAGGQAAAALLPALAPQPDAITDSRFLPAHANDVYQVGGVWRTTDLKKAVQHPDVHNAIQAELDLMPESARPTDYIMVSEMGYL
ncbi:hypothetical protein H4R35_007417, partial [Dimargaris xerosporica]